MQFGKIRDLREDNDLTQFQVAQYLGVKRSTYAMWELGDVNFPIEKLVRLANLFHSNVDYMLDLSASKVAIYYGDNVDLEFIGNQIRRYRLRINKTQREFANYLGVKQSSYSYYEEGKIRIPTRCLISLCSRYHISLSQICGGKYKIVNQNVTKV